MTSIYFRIQYRIRLGSADISDDFIRLEWQNGGPVDNALGAILPGSHAIITLDNNAGTYNQFDPGDGIDPHPGVPVTIDTRVGGGDWVRQFTGFSDGLLSYMTRQGVPLAVINGLGPLEYLEKFRNQVFFRRSGIVKTSEAMHDLLDDVGWPGSARDIQTGNINMFAHKLAKAGAFSSGRQLASFSDSARLISLVEFGRTFDTRDGKIRFENNAFRPNEYDFRPSPNTFFHEIDPSDNVDIIEGTTGNIGDTVINTIFQDKADFVSKGENQDIEFVENLPFSTTIPAGTESTFEFTVALPADHRQGTQQEFVQSWDALVSGTHYEYAIAAGVPTLVTGEDRVKVIVPNRTASAQPFTLIKIQGNPFRRSFLATAPRISAPSVSHYGTKPLQVPADLITDLQEVRQLTDKIVEIHDGVTEDDQGEIEYNPLRRITLTVRVGDSEYDRLLNNLEISNIIRATAEKLGVDGLDFWVDGYQHIVDQDKQHTIRIHLFEARTDQRYNPNRSPIVQLRANPSIVESEGTVTLVANASDPDNHALKYELTSNGGGTFSPSATPTSLSGLTWTAPKLEAIDPDNPDRGDQVILSLTATDSEGLATTDNFGVFVLAPIKEVENNPPEVTVTPETVTLRPGENVLLTATATDADMGDELEYEWIQDPVRGVFSNASESLTHWTANTNLMTQDETITLTCRVTDGVDTATDACIVTIDIGNRDPVVTIVPTVWTLGSGEQLSFVAFVEDLDGDDLTFQWTAEPNVGTFATPTEQNTIWTAPTTSDATTSVVITLTVNDGTTSSMAISNVTVTGVTPRQPPTVRIRGTRIASIRGGESFTLVAVATDPNPEETLTYSWRLRGSDDTDTDLGTLSPTNIPTVTYTGPRVTSRKTIDIIVRVVDSHGLSSEDFIVVHVNPPAPNRLPILVSTTASSPAGRTNNVINYIGDNSRINPTEYSLRMFYNTTSDPITINVKASDADGHTITYRADTNGTADTKFYISQSGNRISVFFTGSTSGRKQIRVYASDGVGDEVYLLLINVTALERRTGTVSPPSLTLEYSVRDNEPDTPIPFTAVTTTIDVKPNVLVGFRCTAATSDNRVLTYRASQSRIGSTGVFGEWAGLSLANRDSDTPPPVAENTNSSTFGGYWISPDGNNAVQNFRIDINVVDEAGHSVSISMNIRVAAMAPERPTVALFAPSRSVGNNEPINLRAVTVNRIKDSELVVRFGAGSSRRFNIGKEDEQIFDSYLKTVRYSRNLGETQRIHYVLVAYGAGANLPGRKQRILRNYDSAVVNISPKEVAEQGNIWTPEITKVEPLTDIVDGQFGLSQRVSITGMDRDNDRISYDWSLHNDISGSNVGTLSGTNNDLTRIYTAPRTTNRRERAEFITLLIRGSDGRGRTGSNFVDFWIHEDHDPDITLVTPQFIGLTRLDDPTATGVPLGSSYSITFRATDPDPNPTFTYDWYLANAGDITQTLNTRSPRRTTVIRPENEVGTLAGSNSDTTRVWTAPTTPRFLHSSVRYFTVGIRIQATDNDGNRSLALGVFIAYTNPNYIEPNE